MSIITTYPFTTPENYLYDSGLIEIVDGKAQLKIPYSVLNPVIKPAGELSVDGLISYLETVVKAGLDDIKTVIEKTGTTYWWNGSAWVASSGYAESNTAAEISANMASWDLSDGFLIRPVLYLHSEDGLTTPQADSITIEYDDHGVQPGAPNKCNVWGYEKDIKGLPVEGVKISATLKNCDKESYNSDMGIMPSFIETETDSTGYWELELVETESISPAVEYCFRFENNGCMTTQSKSVPNVNSKNYYKII